MAVWNGGTMFGWRKRNDGFEWHTYVRTTIKLRRDARREKADALKRQAADGVKAAGAAAGSAARVGANKLGAGSRVAVAGTGSVLGRLATWMAAGLGRQSGSVARLARQGWRSRLGIPALMARLSPRGRIAAAIAAGLVVIGGLSALAGLGGMSMHNFAGLPSTPFASARAIEGRAAVLGPDLIRVGSTIVRLADIEAPERDQRCAKPGNKRWRCGEAAQAALAKLANGRTLKCEFRGTDAGGHSLAICLDSQTDINAVLVKSGHVFARTGFMARYSAQESEAKAAKLGLWSGEAERPSLYRTKMWEEAKRRSPDGCPIKGQMSGSARQYVLPWSPEYERVRVNTARGGRWFCSEQDAISAGWKVAGRG